jgi:hypothetical protein
MISTLARSASCAPNPLHKCDYHELSRQMNDKPIVIINNVISPIKCEIGHCVYNASRFVFLSVLLRESTASVKMHIKSGILQQEHLMFCGIQQASTQAKGKEVRGKEKLFSIPNKRKVGKF